MRFVIALAALLFLATFAPPRLNRPEPPPPQSFLAAVPVPLDVSDPGRASLGRLRYLGGWALSSNDLRFGGISAMHVGDEEVTGLSDAGLVIRFARPDRGPPRTVAIAPLAQGPGSGRRKTDRDIESLTAYGPFAWVAFERINEVWRYRAGWLRDASNAPPAMEDWRANRGPEAMVRLPDGRFLIFPERNGRRTGPLLFEGDPAVPGTRTVALRYRPPGEGYRITDAALLPDGRLLLLHRRFRLLGGISAELLVLRLPELAEGTILSGAEIADFRTPVTVDNMEALSVTQEGGRTIVWIASDDNFSPLQRTLLMKFALDL
ncbi:MAG TPA: esterase-like activity of phytase family protein [Allosphingosinicella sp.]